MTFFPDFSLGWTHAFWFSVLFLATNGLVITLFPSHFKKRVLHMPRFKAGLPKVLGTLNFFIFQGQIFLLVAVPIIWGTPWFWVGLVLTAVAYGFYLTALLNYANSSPDEPVTRGAYALSRNPQQIFAILMWIGIGLMTSCGLIVFLSLFQLFSVYPTFIAQEQDCLALYGSAYRDYMEKTPRYLLW